MAKSSKKAPPPDNLGNLAGRRKAILTTVEQNIAAALKELENPDGATRSRIRNKCMGEQMSKLKDLEKREKRLKGQRPGKPSKSGSVDFVDFAGS